MEKRKFKKYEIVISFIVIFIIFLFAFSYIMYHRSLMATLSEYTLMLSVDDVTEEEVIKKLESLRKQGDVKYTVDYDKFDLSFSEKYQSNMQVFYLNEQENPETVIIYLHGGTYVDRPLYFHWQFLDKLANNTKAEIVIPMYPLAPVHTYIDAYTYLTEFYQSYISEHPNANVILMGDSAGGGLALGLSIEFGIKNIKMPDHLILLSPWVDISMSNEEIKEYEKIDPMLKMPKIKLCAQSWAGDKNLKYWKLSPLYGDFSKLGKVTIFTGTRELLYPDCKLLAAKLEKANVDYNLVTAVGCNHVYLFYPTREARSGNNTIYKIINSMKKEKEK